MDDLFLRQELLFGICLDCFLNCASLPVVKIDMLVEDLMLSGSIAV